MGDYGGAVALKGYNVLDCPDRFLAWSSAFQTLKIFASYAVSGVVPADLSNNFSSVDPAANTLTCNAHGLENGDTIIIDEFGSMPGGLTAFETYYVVNKTANTIQVANTYGGAAIDITSAGSNVYFYFNCKTIRIAHGLGRLTPYIVVFNSLDTTSSYFFSDASGFQLTTKQYTDATEISIDSSFDFLYALPGDTVYFTVYVFLDGFDTVAARNIDLDSASPGSSSDDWGLASSKDGFDVLTCTEDQLAFSSSFFNQIVHMKGIATALPVTHNLGYVPSHLTYLKLNGKTYISMYPFFGTDETDLDLSGILSAGESVYYVILKNTI